MTGEKIKPVAKAAADNLERIKHIESAEMPVEPEVVQRVLRRKGKELNEVRNPNITARECIDLANHIDALKAVIQRKDAELSDAVHLNDEQAQRVYKAEREAMKMAMQANIADEKRLDAEAAAKEAEKREKSKHEQYIALKERHEKQTEKAERELIARRDKDRGDYWMLQPDGGNNLQSLVCPVLIRADDMRDLIGKAERERDALIAEKEILKKAIGDAEAYQVQVNR